MGRIVITKIKEKDFLFLFDDDHEVKAIKCIEETMVDSVYVGRISEINKGLRAAFVSISPEQKVFLPLSELTSEENEYKCGDEIALQISVDPIKTKLPMGTMKICIPGQYCVCHLEGHGVSASKKLSDEERTALESRFKAEGPAGLKKFKWVLRTNAQTLLEDDFSPLFNEASSFMEIGEKIRNAHTRCAYTKLYAPESPLLSIIADIPGDTYDSVITDNKEYYEILNNSELFNEKNITLFDDEYITLKNLHSLETYLARALDKKVYLDCGGYLIIEPTEAMTVIDVNSGKAEGRKKDTASYIYKVNKEAALEIAKQLSIRNISGMIMVDFISMDNPGDNERLLQLLGKELEKDKIRTRLIDMTPLGIVEITRKKVNSPLDKTVSF